MDTILTLISPSLLALSFAIAALAGLVKGMVGFAMPMILISGLSSFLPPELALAGLILSALATNAVQALQQGWRAAMASMQRFGLFLGVGLVFLLLSSQLVAVLPANVLLGMIGAPVVLFCVMQLAGWKAHLPNGPSRPIEAAVGAIAGFLGGMSGVWGPPVVAYLTAIDTEKREQVRVQGVIYGLGAVALTGAHVTSGVLNAQTAQFSALLLIPGLTGMWLGMKVHDRIDQALFRKMTLWVLLLAGLNLLRRALMG
ncbi:sulfite exporter TauE/SafE family protein [Citreicella sp. C3M06]|uniref:sulfite exporter TauE/SafE family protein n=1 Tax=Citreicella sp. C3M06 TaxID=2841564 RepID=UPI001C0933A0|nr:sulfite exporter TauE/SafE family protein [Citreicella sp. C3M06]MBU2959800.1 sulfite exporter TauE/SafE family protein [Citreicella sp. C3M06]